MTYDHTHRKQLWKTAMQTDAMTPENNSQQGAKYRLDQKHGGAGQILAASKSDYRWNALDEAGEIVCMAVGDGFQEAKERAQQIIDALTWFGSDAGFYGRAAARLTIENVALRQMLQQLVDHFGEYQARDFPKPSHEGFCTPESACDCNCAAIAHMAEHNALIRKAKELLTEDLNKYAEERKSSPPATVQNELLSSPPPAPTHAGEHSPEPWKIRPGYSIESSDDKIVCDLNLAHQDRKANAERIVACVNFCAGVSNADLKLSSAFDLKLIKQDAAKQLADLRKKIGESEWVSVEDRLPEDHTEVLAFDHSLGKPFQWTARYDSNFKKWYSTGHEAAVILEVTHWRELPEPPAELRAILQKGKS